MIHQANQKLQEQLKKLQDSQGKDCQESQKKISALEETVKSRDEEILALKAQLDAQLNLVQELRANQVSPTMLEKHKSEKDILN